VGQKEKLFSKKLKPQQELRYSWDQWWEVSCLCQRMAVGGYRVPATSIQVKFFPLHQRAKLFESAAWRK
jgi:hypothetical protein